MFHFKMMTNFIRDEESGKKNKNFMHVQVRVHMHKKQCRHLSILAFRFIKTEMTMKMCGAPSQLCGRSMYVSSAFGDPER